MHYILQYTVLHIRSYITYHTYSMTLVNIIILDFQCLSCEKGPDVPADLEYILMNPKGTVQW